MRAVFGTDLLWWEALLLILGGITAGAVNSVAGGGSMLTVPLLVLAGVPGGEANGSNRVGILTSNVAAVATFRRLGVEGLVHAARVVVPMLVGGAIGSYAVANLLDDDTFETVFGLIMVPIIILTVRKPKVRVDATPWSLPAVIAVFLVIGIYGGAFQAGIGLVLLAALSRSGFDLVTANSIKVIVNTAVTMVALPVYIWQGQVVWLPAIVLAVGLTIGGSLGARLAVFGGEVLIRRVMVVAAVALAGRLVGLY
ncbi:MAG: sulfite exporter TauE/SafE family protein [Actinobacteria bacterium]|nr:sulfite exporter TauE/SafE family protein [Actinomycetota bacterium]NDH83705.1 sulfite exporter TauE/SafE family protein [Acidimicrobiia bacterium]